MAKENAAYKILVVEDNAGDAELVKDYLHEQITNPQIAFASNLSDAILQLQRSDVFDVVLLDLSLPDKNGKELIENILKLTAAICPVVVLTGYHNVEFSKSTIALGISDYLIKDELNAPILYKSIIYAIERWKTTLRLEESEQKYIDLFNQSPQPMLVHNADTFQFVKVNKAAIETYGYTEAEFLKLTLYDVWQIDKMDNVDATAMHHQKPKGQNGYSGIFLHRKKSGELFSVEKYSAVVTFNNAPCFSLITIDITERLKTQEQIKISESRYKKAQAIGKMGNWELDLRNNRITWSDEIYRILGETKQDKILSLQDFLKYIHRDDVAAFNNGLQQLLTTSQKIDLRHRLVQHSGKTLHVHQQAELLKNGRGGTDKVIGTIQDVSDQVHKEIELKQSQDRLSGIIESQTNYVIRTNLGGAYTYYNQIFFEDFGWIYRKDNLIGLNGFSSTMPYDHPKLITTVQRCLSSPNTVYKIEIDKPGQGNTVRTTLWDFVCLTDEHNQPFEMQCIGIDITNWKRAEREFLKSLEEKNTILESIGDAFFAINKQWIITYWNNEAEAVSRLTKAEVMGKNFLELFEAHMNPVFVQQLQRAIDLDEPARFEIFSKLYKRWWDITAYPSESGLSVFLKDISLRKHSDEAIKNNERKLQVLFNTVNEIIYMVDVEAGGNYRFASMNKAGLNAMGLQEDQVVGKLVQNVIPSPSLELVLEKYDEAISTKSTVAWEEVTTYPSGVKTAKVNVSPVFNDRGVCILLVGSINDITDQLAYEAKLKNYNDELRYLTSHLQKVREEERLKMSREIHDELGQQLTGLKMDISWLSKKIIAQDEVSKNKIMECIKLIDGTIGSVRKIAAELRPSIIDDLGLAEAMKWQSKEFAKRSGIEVNCYTNVDDIKYSSDISIALFRIHQESLTNIMRHANASNVICTLEQVEGYLQLTVIDNGKGFIKGQQGARKTLGLLGMKERVAVLGGDYILESKIGEGTAIFVKIPLQVNDTL